MSDPITLAAAGLASFAHLNNLIKSFFEARDRTINLEQVNALQSEIASIYAGYIALQQQASTLLAEKDDLKKEIASFEAWEDQKERYKLYSPWPGSQVYAIKKSQSFGEPPHWVCAQCYQDRKCYPLQFRPAGAGGGPHSFFCNKCGSKIHCPDTRNLAAEYVEE